MDSIDDPLARIADALDRLAPAPLDRADLSGSDVFVWDGRLRKLRPIETPPAEPLASLVGLDRAKERLLANLARFADGNRANHVLFWGARGTGKSALLLAAVADAQKTLPLKLVEARRGELVTLPDLLPALAASGDRVVLFCDDLAFEGSDDVYKALKSALGGGVEAAGENVLVCATSNRRHLAPRTMAENADRDAIRRGEAGHELLSLADRFGLSIGFYEPTQAEYLAIVEARAAGLPVERDELRKRAVAWAAERGARSGRTAAQFVIDLAGEIAK